jgi:hypothetical protein
MTRKEIIKRFKISSILKLDILLCATVRSNAKNISYNIPKTVCSLQIYSNVFLGFDSLGSSFSGTPFTSISFLL